MFKITEIMIVAKFDSRIENNNPYDSLF